jgi:co-chaperonin GroES (HSP10)
MKVKGKIKPLKDKILVSNMDFGFEKTKSGLILMSDDGKTQGIHPRWGKVWAIGPEQKDIKVGEWVCVEHGRWTRTIEFESENDVVELRMVDTKAILMTADEKPDSVMRAA